MPRVTIAYFRVNKLACPFFVPRQIENGGFWLHPSRLPLGAGWAGNCRASGNEVAASAEHVREFCNLGYAVDCPHLPPDRDWDAIRFAVARSGQEQITITFVCELNHTPVEQGALTFDLGRGIWISALPDPRVLVLATSYVEALRTRESARVA